VIFGATGALVVPIAAEWYPFMAMANVQAGLPRPSRRYLRPPAPLYFPEDERVPEGVVHFRLRTTLYLVLEHRLRGTALLGSDQFVYWDPTDPRACLSPDIYVRLGGPLEVLNTIKTWLHGAPHLGVELVSPSDRKNPDLEQRLERYRRCGINEVVRFDNEAREQSLRFWDLFDGDLVERDRSDPEATRCDLLGGYWHVRADPKFGPQLRLADHPDGSGLWLTAEEAASARIAELEAELRRRT
jgi:Uma2 family endonuclease